MKTIRDYTRYLYEHPLVRYILVGGSTFTLDFVLLVILHQKFNIGLAIATSIAYWVAIGYNFILNRLWTFSMTEKESLQKHLTSYLILLGFNYLFTVIFVSVVGRHIYFGLAKAIAVMIQTTWTYIVYRDYIFVKAH